jgi:hypothetical protein
MRNAGVTLVLVGSALSGCASAPSDPVVESAYPSAWAAQAACRPGDLACCAQQAEAGRAAGLRGESARASAAWQEVALACPGRRDEATAAVRALEGTVPAAEANRELLNVTYRVRLSPAVRLYWVATTVEGRLLPRAGAAAGAQALEVEVRAIRFTRSRPGPLLVVNRRFDLVLPSHPAVTIEISEAPAGALALNARVDAPPVPGQRRPVPPTGKAPAPPRLEPARLVSLAPLRAPLEFGPLFPGKAPGLLMCLDRDGQIDTVRFQEVLHPRLAAALVDMLRDSRHEPYRVNDLPVPSCRPFTEATSQRASVTRASSR